MQNNPNNRFAVPEDRLTRFSSRAEDYAKFRPSYPAAAIDAILAGMGEPTGLICLDVGSGTGISARLLAERGCRVIAVEPNEAMRERAELHARVTMRGGNAEETGAEDGSMDVVLAAQAYHWFDEPKALAEFARVLRAGGRLAVMWNVPDERTESGRGYREIMLRYATEPPTSPWNNFCAPRLEGDARFMGHRTVEIPSGQVLDCAGLIGRAGSASYVPKHGRAREQMEADLAHLYSRCERDGVFTLAYVTRVHLAERTER
ncbi:MAG: class I SAM-dependent methyltransferase [Phycisphaeraceae bacterium]|nr:class I SAM-dependent methyltransferase [Phycisphaerales bacterium]MCB9844179.1 class I SAM-dependent methyltransferase [Phycisphaeraceae bacterium]